MPRERLDLSRYAADVLGEAELITPIRAGLLTNWRVDRRGLRIPKKTFAGADLTHWLALQLAAEAIESSEDLIGWTAPGPPSSLPTR